MKVVLRVLGYLRTYWRSEVTAYTCMLGINAMRLIRPQIIRRIVDVGIEQNQVDVLGLSAGGTTLAVLAVLGMAALWLGRAAGRGLDAQEGREAGAPELPFVLSDRAAAIWALACLAAIVPAGIAGLQIVLQ